LKAADFRLPLFLATPLPSSRKYLWQLLLEGKYPDDAQWMFQRRWANRRPPPREVPQGAAAPVRTRLARFCSGIVGRQHQIKTGQVQLKLSHSQDQLGLSLRAGSTAGRISWSGAIRERGTAGAGAEVCSGSNWETLRTSRCLPLFAQERTLVITPQKYYADRMLWNVGRV